MFARVVTFTGAKDIDAGIEFTRDTVSLLTLPRSLERFRELQTSHSTFWGELFWAPNLKQPLLNVRTPVRRIDDAFIGGLVATVAVGDLSYRIGARGAGGVGGGHYFILVDHDKVLAHRRLIDPLHLTLKLGGEARLWQTGRPSQAANLDGYFMHPAARWVRLTYRVDVVGDAADAISIATFASRRATLAARLRRAG